MFEELQKEVQHYFDNLIKEVNECYKIAQKARSRGKDPYEGVEIPPAEDVASRVEELIGPKGVKNRIQELQEKGLDNEKIAFKITKEIIDKKFIKDIDKAELAKLAIRAGLCILTSGITAAPIEGLVDVKIRKNKDGTEYIAMYFSGPIRAAGGTAAAQAVMLGDYVRKLIKLDRYKPSNDEIERYLEEIILYKRLRNLQFPIKAKSIRSAAKNCPIEITGEPTEKEEVTGYRNIWRINTNKVRGGACLVLNDGIIGKAHKLMKIVEKFDFKGWEWLKDLQEKEEEMELKEDSDPIKPKDKFIAGIIAGRPIFSHPSRKEGFRIRYGRVRNTGLAAVGLNKYTMKITGNFLVQGTQFITERPGKASISIAVDSIEGPIVKIFDGSVIKIENEITYKKYMDKIQRILYLGDVLIGFGEFLENNHILIPSGYTEEWWCAEFKEVLKKYYNNQIEELSTKLKIDSDRLSTLLSDPFYNFPNEIEAIKISEILGLPIHPKYTFFWEYITRDDVIKLRNWLLTAKYIDNNNTNKNNKISSIKNMELDLKSHSEEKKILEILGIEHFVKGDKIIIAKYSYIIQKIFNLNDPESNFEFILPTKKNHFVGNFLKYKIRAKAPYRIGGRMGRPEKADERVKFHTLFPVGNEGGNRRDIIKAAENKIISLEIVNRKCPKCNQETIYYICPKCHIRTKIITKCTNVNCGKEVNSDYCPYCKSPVKTYGYKKVNLAQILKTAKSNIEEEIPAYIKGVKGLMNRHHIFEPLEKAILRVKWNLYIFRDGTIRFDSVDAPLTHFTPKEIGLSLDKLKKLGYSRDIYGNKIENSEQIIELKPQDIIIPYNGADFLVKVANFIDELLIKFYHLNPYYNIDTIGDLIGQIVIGLAPHTSAGIIGRIIGFTKSKICYAHPYWHAAKRRNCFLGDTTILININGVPKKVSLYKLYHELFDNEIFSNSVFSKNLPKKDIKVYSFDLESKKIVLTEIIDVIKSPAPEHLIEIILEDNRAFITTYDHPIIVYANGKFIEKKALEINLRDKFLVYNKNYFGSTENLTYNSLNTNELEFLEVREKKVIKSNFSFVYSLNAKKYHTIFVNDNIMTHQCDGDEDSIILLLDALLNFSRLYLPTTRGGMMDAPLVISIILRPKEVDKEVFNLETIEHFPLEFYEATLNYTPPKQLLDKIEIINDRLGKPEEYFNIHYTIPNSTISSSPTVTAYKKYEKIKDKVNAQLSLGIKIDAVDVVDEVNRLLNTHFIPDIIGNMRAFTTQQIRCPRCNLKFRRIPLSGVCPQCNNKLIFTVHEGGIVKYLEIAKELANKFKLNDYIKQRLELIENDINSLFKNRKKSVLITKFFNNKANNNKKS